MRLSLTSIALLAILATLLLLLPRTVTSCPVRTPLDVSCPLENNYLSNPNQSDDILYQDHYMFANYLRRTTKSLRPSSTLRSISSISSLSSSSTSSPNMTSATTNPSTEPQKQENPEDKENKSPQLALPSTSDSSTDQKLDVNGHGTTVSLDHLGPIVVNQDGTMSRISNWEKMTEIEKRNTMRIIGKRNKQRLDALKAAGVEGGNS